MFGLDPILIMTVVQTITSVGGMAYAIVDHWTWLIAHKDKYVTTYRQHHTRTFVTGFGAHAITPKGK